MKVVQLNKYYAPHRGGVETVVQDIAEGLKNAVDMNVFVCNDGRSKEDVRQDSVRLHRSGTICKVGPMPVSLSYLKDVRCELKTADAVLLHMPFPWGDLALRLSGYKGKVFLWWHSDVVRQKTLLRLYEPLMHWALKRADRIIVATRGHIDGSEFLKPYEEKCSVIPFGVEEEYYLAGRQMKKQNDNGPITFLFIGRMVYYKGCDVLIKAFAAMKNTSCRLNMVGQFTSLTEECRQLAQQLGVADRVTFEDDLPREELKKRLAECDVFVLPSVLRSEAFAIVQLEALAFGKPVINTNLPSGVPYVSRDEETGITVQPNDVSALAVAMDTLADDETLRNKYSAAAFKRIEEFRMEKMQQRVLQLFNEVCNH